MRDLLFIARRWWPLVLALALLGAVAGVGVGLAAGGGATSEVRMYARNGEADNIPTSQGTLGMARMASYADLITSSRLAEMIIKEVGLDTDPADLAGSFKTEIPADSQVMSVQVKADTQEEADSVLRALPGQLTALVREVGGPQATGRNAPTFVVVDGPTSTPARSTKTILASALVGLVLGSLLGALVVALRSRSNPALRSPETVAQRAGLAVAGTLPRGAGVTPAHHRLAQRIAGRLPERGVLAVTSVTSGLGEQVARDLADVFAERGRRVAFVPVSASGELVASAENRTAAAAPRSWAEVHRYTETLRGESDLVLVQMPHVQDAARAGAWLDEADACVLVVDQGKDRERSTVEAADDLRAMTRADLGLVVLGGSEKTAELEPAGKLRKA